MVVGFERREQASRALRLGVPVAAVALGLLAGAGVLLAGGQQPADAYRSMWAASFGSLDGIESIAIRATPLVLTGLAVSVALRIGLWNIGGEGQLFLGAVAATGVGLSVKGLPAPLLLVLMFVAALVAGAAWASLASIPRAVFGLNEIITTLFLNYIGILLMQSLIFGPWGDPAAYGFAYSRALPDGVQLPTLGDSGVHVGVLLALAAVVLVWWLIDRTPWGFSVRIAGGNPRAARYLGLEIERRMVCVFALSGALAGLAGVIELTGVTQRLEEGLSINYGYSGVLIAFLAKQRPIPLVAAAILFAALLVGSYALQSTGVAEPIATVIQAVIIIFLLAGELALRYRVQIGGRRKLGMVEP